MFLNFLFLGAERERALCLLAQKVGRYGYGPKAKSLDDLDQAKTILYSSPRRVSLAVTATNPRPGFRPIPISWVTRPWWAEEGLYPEMAKSVWAGHVAFARPAQCRQFWT